MTSKGLPDLNIHAMLEARHGKKARAMDVTADALYPKSEMSALMQSPCRPEENGCFGATYGIASKLFYEYEIESRHGSDFSQVIMVVEEHLMDVVLSVTFPMICSYEGDGRPPAQKTQEVLIRGFRFGREELDMSRTCQPLEDKANYCTRFSGMVHIFGSDIENTVQYGQSVINYAITGALPQVRGLGVQRIEVVDIKRTDPNANNGSFGTFPFPLPVMCGLAMSAICIVLGIILLVLYMRKDKVRHQKLHEKVQKTMSGSTTGTFRYFTSDSKHIDETENGSFTSDISSVKIDFETGTVSAIPSHDFDVKFDLDYSSSCSSSVASSQKQGRALNRESSEIMSHPPHYLDEHGRYFD